MSSRVADENESDEDFLDEMIRESSAHRPDFPELMSQARRRREAEDVDKFSAE